MKHIKFHSTLTEYLSFISGNIIQTDIFKQHPFYRGLVDFIVDYRSPLFFEASHDYEYAHFSQYFNFVLMRGGYENAFISDMFFMHDFMHMAFHNPLRVRDLSYEYFHELTTTNEYVASNDTEIRTYYRLPGMRENSLSYPILYDVLRDNLPECPSARELLRMRKSIILDEQDEGLGGHPDAAGIFAFLRKFKASNPKWTRIWYDQFPEIDAVYSRDRMALPVLDYEAFLERYRSDFSEERYQQNVLQNVQVALQLLGEKDLPANFAECRDAVEVLEGRVILDQAAQDFHAVYMSGKST